MTASLPTPSPSVRGLHWHLVHHAALQPMPTALPIGRPLLPALTPPSYISVKINQKKKSGLFSLKHLLFPVGAREPIAHILLINKLQTHSGAIICHHVTNLSKCFISSCTSWTSKLYLLNVFWIILCQKAQWNEPVFVRAHFFSTWENLIINTTRLKKTWLVFFFYLLKKGNKLAHEISKDPSRERIEGGSEGDTAHQEDDVSGGQVCCTEREKIYI